MDFQRSLLSNSTSEDSSLSPSDSSGNSDFSRDSGKRERERIRLSEKRSRIETSRSFLCLLSIHFCMFIVHLCIISCRDKIIFYLLEYSKIKVVNKSLSTNNLINVRKWSNWIFSKLCLHDINRDCIVLWIKKNNAFIINVLWIY